MADSLLIQKPSLAPPLDPDFRPAALGHRAFAQAVVAAAGGGVPLTLAIERAAGEVSHFATAVLPDGHPRARDNLFYAERLVKFLLWQKGGFKVHVAGPRVVADFLAAQYAPEGSRAFDAAFMAQIYEAPRFVVTHASPAELPAENEQSRAIGGHLGGCRIGFDAGGSDRKVAAVIDGREVFSCEVPWHPKSATDAQYHVDGINDFYDVKHVLLLGRVTSGEGGELLVGRARAVLRELSPEAGFGDSNPPARRSESADRPIHRRCEPAERLNQRVRPSPWRSAKKIRTRSGQTNDNHDRPCN